MDDILEGAAALRVFSSASDFFAHHEILS
jgi:hypothetical protein